MVIVLSDQAFKKSFEIIYRWACPYSISSSCSLVAQSSSGNISFAFLQLENTLFNAICNTELPDVNLLSSLTNPMNSVYTLVLYCRIPPRILKARTTREG